jgi:hypothetical protein
MAIARKLFVAFTFFAQWPCMLSNKVTLLPLLRKLRKKEAKRSFCKKKNALPLARKKIAVCLGTRVR